MKIARLSSCKNFVSEREKFILDAFVDLQPLERFEHRSDMSGFRSLNNSTSKRVLNLLEPVELTVWICVFVQGKLVGYGIEEQLPTVAVVAHYDAFGVAPVIF